METIEQIARRCWQEMDDTENPPWQSIDGTEYMTFDAILRQTEALDIEELARRVVAAWCDQGPVPVAVIDDDTESQVRLLPSIGVKNGTKLYTRPAPPQSCSEAEYIGRIVALECELQAVKAELSECDKLREKLGNILHRTAIAIRGPEPELTRWSWHDLPERAEAAIAALDLMQRAAIHAAAPEAPK